jgi:hypothetical protein
MHSPQSYNPYSYYPYNLYQNYGFPRGDGLFSSQRIVSSPATNQAPYKSHKEKEKKQLKG